MFSHQFHICKGSPSGGKSSRSFNKFSPCLCDDLAHFYFFFLCKQTGLNDHLQDPAAAGLVDLADFLFDFFVLLIFQLADIDDHIDLRSSICNSILCLKYLSGCGAVAVWKTDHCADRQFSLYIFGSLFYIRSRNTGRGCSIFYGVIQDLPDLLPGCSLCQ